jgi:hypothetical protein
MCRKRCAQFCTTCCDCETLSRQPMGEGCLTITRSAYTLKRCTLASANQRLLADCLTTMHFELLSEAEDAAIRMRAEVCSQVCGQSPVVFRLFDR